MGVIEQGKGRVLWLLLFAVVLSFSAMNIWPVGAAAASQPELETIESCIKAGKVSPTVLMLRAESNRDNYHDDVSFIEGTVAVKFPAMPDDCYKLVRRQVNVKIHYSTTGIRRFGTTGIHNRVIHDIGGFQSSWIPICPRSSLDRTNDCSDGRKPTGIGFQDDYFHTSRYGRLKKVKAVLRVRLLDVATAKSGTRRYFSTRTMKVPTRFERRNPMSS